MQGVVMRTIPERDWKKLRLLHPELLEEACERIFAEVRELIDNEEEGSHSRYRALFRLMRERDREIADMFNDLKRSNAIYLLAAMRHHGLLTDALIEQFSEETKTSVKTLLSVNERWADSTSP
jgi:hypothetical protein